MEGWGQYFKPAGMSQNTGDPQKPATPKAAPAASHDDEDDIPVPVAKATPAPSAPKAEAPAGGDSRAQDILAMIRNRQK